MRFVSSFVLACALLFGIRSEAAPVPLRLDRVFQAMRFEGVSISAIKWEDCGSINAWYAPVDFTENGKTYKAKSITLCNELRELPAGAIRFVFAHELAHAVIHQRGVPFTGSEEVAADELAAVILGLNKWGDDIREMAAYFGSKADSPVPPWDPHPDYDERAFTLYCYADASEGVRRYCSEDWTRAVLSWFELLY
jgi:hypothetical protein